MKVKFLALALFATVVSATSFAQQQQQCEGKQCCPKEQKEMCKGPQGPQGQCPIMGALKDVQLTDAQRTAIENLGKEKAEANKQKCDKSRKERAEADSLARVAQRQEQLDMLHSLKSILTADQYVSFLENAVLNAQQGPRPEGRPGEFGRPGEGQPRPECHEHDGCKKEGEKGQCCKESKK
jgi:Spy/CpxP family protein refolding chaperone